MSKATPLLYSFRRCPYAIRARMALFSAQIPVIIEEVSLKAKPAAMLAASAKGTVPVLCLGDRVIDESLEIMHWALSQHDPDNWQSAYNAAQTDVANALIAENDGAFKQWLDRYKYADRYPGFPQQYYRMQGEQFLAKLEAKLALLPFLINDKPTFVDVAIFPFIRQFAMVDQHWFDSCNYPQLRNWLNYFIESPLFKQVFAKH